MTIELATTPETEVAEEETPVETPETPEVQLDDNGEPIVATPEVEETEEVEHEGKKYKLPKPLKGALLMQADYTRKTQALADERKADEAKRTEFAKQQELQSEFVKDFGKLEAMDETLKLFEKVDWQTLFTSDKARYDELQFQRTQTIDARNKAYTALNTKVAERNSKAQQDDAKRREDFQSAVAREIPGWNPELAGKLDSYARSQGLTAEELGQVRDPRLVKILHAAYLGSQATTKAAVVKKVEVSKDVQPLKTVSANTSTAVKPTDAASDRLSTEEWAKRRNAQVGHKQRGVLTRR